MRPLTDTMPKPLLSIRGKSLLTWHLEALVKAGLQQVVINHAWLGKKIEDALGDGRQLGIHITYSPELVALETAGGIYKALPLMQPLDYCLVINGDIFCPHFPIVQLLDTCARFRTISNPPLAHLVMVPNPVQHPHGDFYLKGDQILEDLSIGTEKLTFSGIGLYHRDLFQDLQMGVPFKLAPLLLDAMRKQRVTGEKYTGIWHDVGTPQRLQDLNVAHE